MNLVIIALSNILTVVAAVPYLIAIVRGTTKPRVASWFGWGALTLVGAAASFAQHQLPAGIFLSFCALQNFSIVVLGLKHGDRRFGKLDIFCVAGALLGAAVLLFLKSPVLSTWVAIGTDFVVMIPTLKHTWQQPGEETVATYILEGIASVLTLTVAGGFAFTAIAYPLYLLIADEVITVLIFKAGSRRQFDIVGTVGTVEVTPRGNVPTPGTQVLPDARPAVADPPVTLQ
jgi:hypothetical protein